MVRGAWIASHEARRHGSRAKTLLRSEAPARMLDNLCDVPGVRVGHATDAEGATGCTVVLFDPAAVMGGDVRGASPGTRETDILNPMNAVQRVGALLLTGGSTFGLASAEGVMEYLEEKMAAEEPDVFGVPAVPGAVVFDLRVGSKKARPDARMGREAAESAESGAFEEGSVGAGTGATVGKMLGMENAMKGGLGSASVSLPGGVVVAALMVVNPVGDVRDSENGRIIAGPRRADGTLADSVRLLAGEGEARPGENTTIGVVATNARLDKAQINRVSWMAHDGLARTVYPVHTHSDGDAVFAAATGEVEVSETEMGKRPVVDVIGGWGAYAAQCAILAAVRSATGVPGIPSVSEYEGGER